MDVTGRSDALALLRRVTGRRDTDFRRGQWEAIDSLANRGGRLLVVERTAWGKSAVYFIATRILRDRGRGPTLIVSPLLALMRNQMEAAERLGVRALSINSTNRNDWPALRRAVLGNEADALLISPERLANDEFVEDVLLPVAERIGLMVVDEAHCISDWGHDFRPDYRRLVSVLRRIPDNVPVLGTTATANNRVVADVRGQFGDIRVQRGTLMRETLALQSMRLPSQMERLSWLARHIDKLPGTGIIYTLTQRDAERVASWLTERNISAKAYHSAVRGGDIDDSNAYRRHLEDLLLHNEIKALVATTALGMGYDKPDIGFVVHFQAPSSVVAYYQQVGRAGRGIKRAIGVLMSGAEDDDIHAYFRRSAFPREQWVGAILQALEESDGLSVPEVERAVNLRRGQIEQALKFLSVEDPAPVLKSGSVWRRTPVAYTMDRDRIRRLTAQRELEWQEMQSYIDDDGCSMQYLMSALDDTGARPCGKCEACLGRPVVKRVISRAGAFAAGRFLRRSEIPFECRKSTAKGTFVEYGFQGSLPEELRAEEGRILSRWGDSGWGRPVADDKGAGRFRDALVDAAVEMVRERWKPSPPPEWVTAVPSRTQPDLVPDYARRLAAALGLPFAAVVTKARDNEPQKEQENGFHQCRNLDGAFAVRGPLANGPVLLIDDVVDSRWTLTVVAALLRRSGSGPVWPLALATANLGL